MKIENQQSNITNPQFSGGRPIGASSGAQSTANANAIINFSGITTGSTEQAKAAATITTTLNGARFAITGSAASGTFFLTSSGQTDAPPLYYIPTASTVAGNVINIADEINKFSASFNIIAVATGSVLQLTSSVYGVAGNSYNFTSASVVTTLAGGLTLATGSFTVTDAFGVVDRFIITSTPQLTANSYATQSVNGDTYYISGSSTQVGTVTNIAAFLNVSASAIVQATGSTNNLQLTSSINGVAGNLVNVLSGSTTTYLTGGAGNSTYPYNFPFLAGGLYVGTTGTVVATAINGNVLSFVSASAGSVIPGLFQSVSSSSTAKDLIALN